MSSYSLNTPVAFMIFNRSEATKRVFAEIAKAKPPTLLVIADGPRKNKPGELEKCQATRAVIEQVDWDCEVLTCFSDTNLGCKNRIASGLDWVFEQVPEAIILEDDCLPHPTFFRFCEELLERYRDDERIGMISGDNFQFGRVRTQDSYYFSRYTHIWGWATWRRAWKYYDRDINAWPKLRRNAWLANLFSKRRELIYWTQIFDKIYKNQIDTWDYQWCFACWQQTMLAVMPSVNLISNIGYGIDGSHTRVLDIYASLPTFPMNFPLKHPVSVLTNEKADNYTQRTIFTRSAPIRLFRKLKGLLNYLG